MERRINSGRVGKLEEGRLDVQMFSGLVADVG